MRRHRFDRIGNRHDPDFKHDLVTGQALRIAGTVHALMMLEHGIGDWPVLFDGLQDDVVLLRMLTDQIHFSA